jgi:hypothetical protein
MQAIKYLVARGGVEPKEPLGLARREAKARHFQILAPDAADEVVTWADARDDRHVSSPWVIKASCEGPGRWRGNAARRIAWNAVTALCGLVQTVCDDVDTLEHGVYR